MGRFILQSEWMCFVKQVSDNDGARVLISGYARDQSAHSPAKPIIALSLEVRSHFGIPSGVTCRNETKISNLARLPGSRAKRLERDTTSK